MIFVDTGAWYASVVVDDVDHAAARQWLEHNTQPLLTTDYILDETLTLLRMRGYPQLAMELGVSLFAEELADLIRVSDDDLMEAWLAFRKFDDKQWSFTDCCSKVVMERLHITHAFSFDHHFRQFGTVAVVP